MKIAGVHSCAAVAALAFGCTSGDRAAPAWHDEPPPLVVRTDVPAESLVLAAVVRVPAPAIRFEALVEPDLNHVLAVTAPVDGFVVRIDSPLHARSGQSVAVVQERSHRTGREVTVAAPADGAWRPRRLAGQFVWRYDTLGAVWEHGSWLAVGSVSELEYGVVHRGDPATILSSGREAATWPGSVEQVLPPGTGHPYSAQIAVDFAGPESLPVGATRVVTVVVTPTGPLDSLWAVPASAVVRLASGFAVFVPRGAGRYEVRWVSTGVSAGHQVTVRGGVESGTRVVTGGIQSLAATARDSLAAWHARRPATRRRSRGR